MPGQGEQARDVLEFWFVQSRPRQWFAKDPAFDELVRERFIGLTRQAISGALAAWGGEPQTALALVLLLDQFPRQFWLMPLMHSEDLAVQESALPLFERYTDSSTIDFARKHRDVIARFGRFPHRNALLGRVLSTEELAFLQRPGSRF